MAYSTMEHGPRQSASVVNVIHAVLQPGARGAVKRTHARASHSPRPVSRYGVSLGALGGGKRCTYATIPGRDPNGPRTPMGGLSDPRGRGDPPILIPVPLRRPRLPNVQPCAGPGSWLPFPTLTRVLVPDILAVGPQLYRTNGLRDPAIKQVLQRPGPPVEKGVEPDRVGHPSIKAATLG